MIYLMTHDLAWIINAKSTSQLGSIAVTHETVYLSYRTAFCDCFIPKGKVTHQLHRSILSQNSSNLFFSLKSLCFLLKALHNLLEFLFFFLFGLFKKLFLRCRFADGFFTSGRYVLQFFYLHEEKTFNFPTETNQFGLIFKPCFSSAVWKSNEA